MRRRRTATSPRRCGIFRLSFSGADKARLTGAYQHAVRSAVLPSLRKLAAFIETEYLPAARTDRGLGRPA